MKTYPLFILLTALLLTAGCISEDAENVNQNRIITTYRLEYDHHHQISKAIASFRFGSTFLVLNAPAEILVDGQTLRKQEILGIVTYERELNDAPTSVTFTYKDLDDNTFVNTVAAPDPIAVVDTITFINRMENKLIGWEGAPVRSDETVWLHIVQGNSSSYSKATTSEGSNSILVEAGSFSDTMEGEVEVYFVRNRPSNLEQGTEAGGERIGSYTSARITVLLE